MLNIVFNVETIEAMIWHVHCSIIWYQEILSGWVFHRVVPSGDDQLSVVHHVVPPGDDWLGECTHRTGDNWLAEWSIMWNHILAG